MAQDTLAETGTKITELVVAPEKTVLQPPPEKPDFTDTRVLVYEDPDSPVMSTWLRQEGYPLGNEERGFRVESLPTVSNTSIREALRRKDWKSQQILGKTGETPDIIVIPVPNKDSFLKNHYLYQQLFADYWVNIPSQKRPIVVMYTMGFEPQLYQKHDYEGFVWANSSDSLKNSLALSRRLAHLKGKAKIFTPEGLSLLQREQYDQSLDLHEWEHQTVDTYQTLRLTLQRIWTRDSRYQDYRLKRYLNLDQNFSPTDKEAALIPERPTQTILDCGTGDGRIAGMLARLGYNVIGIDISPEQLARGERRLIEEGEGLRGEKEHPELSYPSLRRFLAEEKSPLVVVTDDKEAKRHYVTVQGSFFELNYVLNEALVHWQEQHPEIDLYEFFGETRWNEYAFSDPRDMFTDAGFDYVLFTWNTLCEAGSPDNLSDIFRQLLNVMNRGAELVIEIPDRDMEPYAIRIREYHQKHPSEPFGVLREVYQEKEYSPRYFPDSEEMILLLETAGFEIDPERDIQTYFVTSKDPQTGKESIQLKELFITARKSKH